MIFFDQGNGGKGRALVHDSRNFVQDIGRVERAIDNSLRREVGILIERRHKKHEEKFNDLVITDHQKDIKSYMMAHIY